MDTDGIGVAYLYPSLITSLIAVINSAAFASALVHAYNDWLLEYCSVDLHRLRPVALVPQQDLVLAVEEMERMVSMGVNAIMLRPNPVLGMTISHPNYERVWSAAEEMDVVIGIHEGLGVHWAVPEAGVDRCRTVMQAHIVSAPGRAHAGLPDARYRSRAATIPASPGRFHGERGRMGTFLAQPNGRTLGKGSFWEGPLPRGRSFYFKRRVLSGRRARCII